LQIGSQSSVLDLAAGGSLTALIVSGIDAIPTVYICGVGDSATEDGVLTRTIRISSIEKVFEKIWDEICRSAGPSRFR
jgi:hypothetical protein